MVSLPPEAERGWIPIIFDRGVGARRAQFGARQSRFGRLLTFVPGQTTLPLRMVETTPTDISASKTDYASMIEVYIGGAWRVILVKGTKAWNATGAAFGAADETVASAQGRQLVATYCDRYAAHVVFWVTGSGANIQYTTDGTTWQQAGSSTGLAAVCAFPSAYYYQQVFDTRIYAIKASDNELYTMTSTAGWTQEVANITIPPESATGVIPLGSLAAFDEVYLANGPSVWHLEHSVNGYLYPADIYSSGLPDTVAGCKYGDEFALAGPAGEIVLWHPTRPSRNISIWRDEGCPPDMAGKVRSLQQVGDYLLALWELDAGGTIVFMGRQVANDKFDWHPISATITGEFPLSIGSPFLMAQATYSGNRRLWVCTADASNGRAYYQDWPKPSWNPLDDTAMEYEYTLGSTGWLYQYSPWYDLITASALLAEMKRAMAMATVTATSLIHLAYRPGPDAVDEETYSWGDDLLFNDKSLAGDFPERPRPQMVQFRLGMQRASGTATDTPILFNLFLSAWERAERGLETLR